MKEITIRPDGLRKLKYDLIFKSYNEIELYEINRESMSKIIDKLTEKNITDLLKYIIDKSKSKTIDREIDMFKMMYGIDYDKMHMHKVISGKYNLSSTAASYHINKVLDSIKRYLKIIVNNNNSNTEINMEIYIHDNHMDQDNTYMKHLSAMTREKLHSKADIAGELAGRDLVIKNLNDKLKLLLDALDELPLVEGNKNIIKIASEIEQSLSKCDLSIYTATSLEYDK